MLGAIGNKELMALKDQYVPQGVFNTTSFFLEKSEGSFLYDIDGKKYIDFASGLGVINFGHGNPQILNAIKNQADKFLHSCFHVAMYENYILLAKELSELLPGKNKAFFVNSGAEAVENAIKVAKHYTKRKSVICFEGGFHGRTLLGMSLTSKISPYKKGFGPFAAEVYRFPYAYWYRCQCGLSYAECGKHTALKLEEGFNSYVDPEDVACIIVEPILGEGGFVVPPPEFLQTLSQIAKKYGILLILDEVQAGMGRTGKIFAFEHFGITPDIVTLAKSLGGGLPIGAVAGRTEILDSAQIGGLGGTFGGNPLSCSAALEIIKILKESNILTQARDTGNTIINRLNDMKKKFNIIGDVRGLGAMAAIELVKNQKTKEPAKNETKKVLEYCHKNGLVILKAGVYDNVIRILTPLTINNVVLNEGLDILEAGVNSL